MYMLTRSCKALPKSIKKVQQTWARLDFQVDKSIWCCPTLNGSLRHISTSETEDKHIPCSSQNIAQIKKEQSWCYDPTIKYEALRQCAVPRFAYYDDSATDWTDSDIEIETMTEEEVQSHKEKILAEAKEELPFKYHPSFNYEILKQFFYLDSPDSLAYSNLILGSHTKEEKQIKMAKYRSMTKQLYLFGSDPDCETKTTTKTESETETIAEDEAHKDKILAGTKDEELFRYDPSIKFEPLKRYIVPRFDFFDSSSTDWSDSSDSSVFSDAESETETKTDEVAGSQQGKILAGSKEKQLFCGDLVKSLSTDLQSMADDWGIHGDESPAQVGDKVLKLAKEMDLYTGVDKVTNDD